MLAGGKGVGGMFKKRFKCYDPGARIGTDACSWRVGNHNFGSGVDHQTPQLLCGEQRIERQHYSVQTRAGEQADDELGTIWQYHGDTIAPSYAKPVQSGGAPANEPMELVVPDPPGTLHDRQLGGIGFDRF
jgi:hypothetical protein